MEKKLAVLSWSLVVLCLNANAQRPEDAEVRQNRLSLANRMSAVASGAGATGWAYLHQKKNTANLKAQECVRNAKQLVFDPSKKIPVIDIFGAQPVVRYATPVDLVKLSEAQKGGFILAYGETGESNTRLDAKLVKNDLPDLNQAYAQIKLEKKSITEIYYLNEHHFQQLFNSIPSFESLTDQGAVIDKIETYASTFLPEEKSVEHVAHYQSAEKYFFESKHLARIGNLVIALDLADLAGYFITRCAQ